MLQEEPYGSLTSYKKYNIRKVHLEQKVFVFNHTLVLCLQSSWYFKCGSGVYPMKVRSTLTGLKTSRPTTALLESDDVGGHIV